MASGLLERGARSRIGLGAAALSCAFLAGCLGGPHPLPPFGGDSESAATQGTSTPTTTLPATTPTMANSGAAGTAATAAMQPPTAPSKPSDSPQTTPPAGMMTPGANGAGGTGAPSAAAGSAAQPTQPTTTPPPPAAGGAAPDAGACEGATAPLAASEVAPNNLLFVLDRSAEMAGDFHGAPRWQVASQALSHTLSARANDLTLGAVLYPSGARAPCTGPDWLCSLQPPAMCTVNPMASNDQLAFQPASQALGTLVGSSGIYAPVMAAGVPLAESLARADAALAGQSLSGSTAVVVVASGMPSCDWSAAMAHDTIARWKSRGIPTYVVTLPGSQPTTAQALASLAEAGGTGRVRAPSGEGALEATLQSIVFNSFSSCTLELNPPAPNPNAVQLLVTQAGVERPLPRASASGEPQWMISADGKTVTLLGATCEAAKRGDYDALRVVLSCARP